MNEREIAGLAGIRDCWIVGGSAFADAPSDWKEIAVADSVDERERRLLAIVGQAFDVALRPAAPTVLQRRAPLPRLSLPTMPERLRALFRIALQHSDDARMRSRVAALVAARGFVAHPLDWMPLTSDLQAPRVYSPWVDWRANVEQRGGSAPDILTGDNWDEFYPAARRQALSDMRMSDPASARALIEANAPREAADTRLALVALLRIGLNADDAPFLKSLSGDRSGKINRLAAQLLARLGENGGEAESEAGGLVAELAEFIEQDKTGLIRRRTVYSARKLKSGAQQYRRAELFKACQLIDLAAKFSVSELDFIAAWRLGVDDAVDMEFAEMVAASGSDEAATQLADAFIAASMVEPLAILLQRLDDQRRRRFTDMVLSDGLNSLRLLNTVDEIAPGSAGCDDIMASRAYKEMRAAFAGSNDAARQVAHRSLAALGFLATAPAAQSIVADLVEVGLGPAEAALALLRLNAALNEA